MVSACHSIARWLTQAGRLVAILYASISPHRTPRFYGPTKPLFDKTSLGGGQIVAIWPPGTFFGS